MHHHPALARLAAATTGRDEYCRVLARSYGFYIMAEPALGLGGKLTDCLVADMTELGMTPAAIAALPRCTNLGCVQEHSALIGVRYVLISASLGGKVMARAITGWTGGDGALPVRFLTGMTENDLKAFAAGLETHLPDGASNSTRSTTPRWRCSPHTKTGWHGMSNLGALFTTAARFVGARRDRYLAKEHLWAKPKPV